MPEQHNFGGTIVLSTPTDTPPTGQVVGAVYLDDGTNTGSGNPDWRRLASTGPDVWVDMDGGGAGAPLSSLWLGGDYTYTQAATPVEEVIGGNTLDGSLVTTSANFKAIVTNLFDSTGVTRVRLYDMGTPSTPGSPRLVSQLLFSSNSGPRSVEQALTVVSSGEAEDDDNILNVERVYEAVVVQDTSTAGDVAYVGSVSLEVI